MAKINNLYYQSVIFWSWDDIQYYINSELDCEYIKLNEIERVEDDIYVTFKILDREKKSDILSFFKQYCDNEDVYDELLNYIDDKDASLPDGIVLNILTKTLKKHDKRIKVVGWSAEYYGVAVRFDFEEPLVKTAIAAIHRDSILEDLKGLLLKVTEDVNESYLQNRIGDAINTINKESQLDFVVEDALTEYMKLHFSNYSFDILDGEDFDKSIVSIALGY